MSDEIRRCVLHDPEDSKNDQEYVVYFDNRSQKVTSITGPQGTRPQGIQFGGRRIAVGELLTDMECGSY
jgi:hypothetical protein